MKTDSKKKRGSRSVETDSASSVSPKQKPGKKLPKIFVLDTNVLLHDYRSLYKFQDNDIVIPLVDLEEIDHFKKGNDQINFNAREIMRSLDKLAGKGLFEEGIQLGRNMGKLSVVIGKGLTRAMKEAAMEDIPDHRILAVALDLQEEHSQQGSPSTGRLQLSALAKIRADVVLPIPRGPTNRYACAICPVRMAFFNVRAICSCPTMSENLCGRHFLAVT